MFCQNPVKLQQHDTLTGLQRHSSSTTARALTPEQPHAVLRPIAARSVPVRGHGSHGMCNELSQSPQMSHTCLVLSTSHLLLQIDCSCGVALWIVLLPAYIHVTASTQQGMGCV